MLHPDSDLFPEKFQQDIQQYELFFGGGEKVDAILNGKPKLRGVNLVMDNDIEKKRNEILEVLFAAAMEDNNIKVKVILFKIWEICDFADKSIDEEKFNQLLKTHKLDDIIETIFCENTSKGNLKIIPYFLAEIIKDEKRDDEVVTYIFNTLKQSPQDNEVYTAAKKLVSVRS